MNGAQAAPPEGLARSVDEFNREEWYRCHETLEDLWRGSRGESRHFYQGLLQIAAALHHWHNGNFAGAVSLLAKGADLLTRAGDCWPCLASRPIVEEAQRFRAALLVLGPRNMADVDRKLIPRLTLVDPGHENRQSPP